ncbi:S-layer homology domain-containing protein [Romboutsia lituseburensis]|uniref:S-layer homology domain-containing protein n=1 Tax=Romboutsia lituseburensis TaxID=1537 RepID=UPI00215A8A6A|nr:S-layer homology domain-containing protein [Romboutsia lituseburensis]MCR8745434.1 S-layer homology domain-containing protein [Romboutsia lituseburensis]
MKKKNLATVMAAAMTLGAMPTAAFAADKAAEVVNLDVRKANGEVLATTDGTVKGSNVFTRKQAFNTNFTSELNDDTLKVSGRVIKEFKGANEKTKEDYYYVIAQKAKATEVEVAKAQIAAAKAEIEDYASKVDSKGKKIYKIETSDVTDMTRNGDVLTDTNQVVKVMKGDVTVKTYNFNGTEYKASEDLNKLFKFDNYEMTFVKDEKKSADRDAKYYKLNEFKYVVEQNAAKFDIVKKEADNGSDLIVEVYAKGHVKGDAAVRTMTLKDVKNVDKDLVINMPAKTDIDGHWAEKEIKEAMLKGNIDASAKFRAKDGITRAEFSKIVCTVFGIEAKDTDEEIFTDVKKGDWHYDYVRALYNAGTTTGTVINGYADETFKPSAQITRQEAAKMIASAYEITKKEALSVAITDQDEKNGFKEVNTKVDGIVEVTKKINGETIHRDIKTKFKDDKEIASWADESVEALKVKDIVKGNPDGTFGAKSNITRAEALVMLMRAGK